MHRGGRARRVTRVLQDSQRPEASRGRTQCCAVEDIEDARRRYQRKRWAHNWVVKRTTDLHRRGADAAGRWRLRSDAARE